MCREAAPAVIELETLRRAVFRAPRMGESTSARFGGMSTNFGEGQAMRTCAAADRTGHAILHALYQQSLKYSAKFLIEYFVIDLIMDDEGVCRGVIAWNLDDGTLHRFNAALTVLATGGLRAGVFLVHLGAYLHRRRQRDGAACRAAPSRTSSFISVSIRPEIYGSGCLITEGAARRGGVT